MPWFMITIAGLLEILWAYSAKQSSGFTRWGWAAVTIASSLASFFLLTFSMRNLPLGTAYAVWTGIGTAGSFLVGVWLLGEPLGAWRVLSAALVVAGIVGLRLASSK